MVKKHDDLELLRNARDKIITVYKDLAIDDLPDDGNLTNINNAILSINIAIN